MTVNQKQSEKKSIQELMLLSNSAIEEYCNQFEREKNKLGIFK